MIQYSFKKHPAPQILKTLGIKNGQAKLSNHGESDARGTIIAFSPKLHPVVHDTIVDDQGRSIILDCLIFKHHITLVNIYGPNTDASAEPSLKVLLRN